MIAYIALGSNLNHPKKQVEKAVELIQSLTSVTLISTSSLYETAPLGPQDQPHYINQAITIETGLSAHDLLAALQAIENKMGRVRTIRWGARIIDCDLILYGNDIIHTETLTVPHPEMTKRTFVLEPLAEIAPDLMLPSGITVKNALDRLYEQENRDLPGDI